MNFWRNILFFSFFSIFLFSYFPSVSAAEEELSSVEDREGAVDMVEVDGVSESAIHSDNLEVQAGESSLEGQTQPEEKPETVIDVDPSTSANQEVQLEQVQQGEKVEQAAAEVSTTSEPQTVTIAQFLPSDRYFEVTDNEVSIYDNSTGTLKIVGYLNKGQVYPRVADYGDWHQIKYGNGYGYIWKASTKPSNASLIHNINPNLRNISLSFEATDNVTVYDNSSGSLVPFASLYKNTIYPVINDYGDWYRIDVSGRLGFVYKAATTQPFKPTDRYFSANENVTVYDNSTGSLVPVGELKRGDAYPRVADLGDWHQIKFGNKYGYVWEDSTNPIGAGWMSNENKFLKNNPDLTFRAVQDTTVYDNSSGALVPFGVLYKDTVNQAISLQGDWLQIDFAGRVGYVYKGALQIGPIFQYKSYDMTLDQMWEKQLKVGNLTDKKYQTYVRSDALLVDSVTNPTYGVAAAAGWNVRGGPSASYWQVGTLQPGEKVSILNKVNNNEDGYLWLEIKYEQRWRTPNPEDLKYYLNPANARPWTKEFFQFLSLSQSAGVSAEEVNGKILAGKGILAGRAQSFINAAKVNNINEIYLMSHALLETGNGTSQLAQGVLVSEVNGQPVEPKTVYNMYGIHAYDSCPLQCGSEYAYEQGWFTPEDAIIGGAKWIGDGYINDPTNRQDTLYKMKWNPAYPTTGNYASDIAWAYKQVNNISELYSIIDSYILIFEVPVYKQ